MEKADIALIGMAVMGENLILNLESKGFTVSCYNRTVSKVDRFIEGRARGKKIIGYRSIPELIASLKIPRKVMLMVKAGPAVDLFIEQILPRLQTGDIIIDGGNSNFQDTIRRTEHVENKGKLYIGAGISGGEEGALTGPSIMPGGSINAWEPVKPVFQKIAARTDDDRPCCQWIGENGAGHFVKMVHNGIEYGDMQMICESYHLLKQTLGLSNSQMSEIFDHWNHGELKSYLIEITRDILEYKDENGIDVIDLILDTAGQKGTGKWAAITALDLGQPLTLIGEAVFARCLSALKDERLEASGILATPVSPFNGDRKTFIDDVRQALYAAKIVCYAQGFQLMRAAAAQYHWRLNYGDIALIWRNGCIIRSVFLDKIKQAFDKNPHLVNLLFDPFFKEAVQNAQPSWRRLVAAAVELAIPIPALSAALAYYDGYRCPHLPANLLQAQRDYFGAHTYERIDKPRGEFFHTNWTERGGKTASSPYNV